MTTSVNGLTINDMEKAITVNINKTRIIENVMVKSDFKRCNSSVSALRRSRRAAYENQNPLNVW